MDNQTKTQRAVFLMAAASLIGVSACSPLAGTSVDKGYYMSQKNGRNQGSKTSDSSLDHRIETLIFSKSAWEESETRSRSWRVSNTNLRTLFAEGSISFELGPSMSRPVALSLVINGEMNELEAECEAQQSKIIESLGINLVQLQSSTLSWADSETSELRNCVRDATISAHLIFAENL